MEVVQAGRRSRRRTGRPWRVIEHGILLGCVGAAAQLVTPRAGGAQDEGYSVTATLGWPDGSTERVVVYSASERGSLSLPSLAGTDVGGRFLQFEQDGQAMGAFWDRLVGVRIQAADGTGRSGVELTTNQGEVMVGVIDTPSRIPVYWNGLPAGAKGWTSISDFERGPPIPLPRYRAGTSCSTAAGCRSSSTPWGVWRFESPAGNSQVGLVTGGFGVDGHNQRRSEREAHVPVGIFPGQVMDAWAEEESGRFELEAVLAYAARRFDFRSLARGSIDVEFTGGARGTISLDRGGVLDLQAGGYLTWSWFGEHQVRCVVRVRSLESMEVVETAEYDSVASMVSQIPRVDTYWTIETRSRGSIRAAAIHGHQRQQVPRAPPDGRYWLIRPPTEAGEIAGDYLVAPIGVGYCLLPLGLVAELEPAAGVARLRPDAGGGTIPLVRFHPGDRWISNGTSGRQYIDEEVDQPVRPADMWLTYEGGGRSGRVALTDVVRVYQIPAGGPV